MLGCLGREVTAVVSVVDCVASVVDYEARSEDAEVMVVAGTLLAVATSRTRICIRITRVRTSRQVDTAARMMGDMREGTAVVLARGVMSRSPANKLWFAT